jgi:hypothetical protein
MMSEDLLKRYIRFIYRQIYDCVEFPEQVPHVDDGFTQEEVDLVFRYFCESGDEEEEAAASRHEVEWQKAEKAVIGFGMNVMQEAGYFRFNLHCGTSIPYAITPPVLSVRASGQFPRRSDAQCPWDFVGGTANLGCLCTSRLALGRRKS